VVAKVLKFVRKMTIGLVGIAISIDFIFR